MSGFRVQRMIERFLNRQVRSTTLDTWLPEQVEFMDRTGNAVANAYWVRRLPLPGP